MNYVIIGYGGRGEVYSRLLKNNPKANLVAVCDVDEKKLQLVQKNFGLSSSNLFLDEDEFFMLRTELGFQNFSEQRSQTNSNDLTNLKINISIKN